MKRRDFLSGVGAACLLMQAGCVTTEGTKPEKKKRKLQTVWPLPPDPARYKWAGTFRSSSDVQKLSEEDSLKQMLTGWQDNGVSFGKPFGVAARKGVVYVTDTKYRIVHAFDAPRRRYFQFGFRREGTLGKPLGIAADANGRVYVVDGKQKRVVVYDNLGLWERFVGDKAGLLRPTGVAASPDGKRVFVVDTGGIDSTEHRVIAFDDSGQQLFSIGTRGSEPGQFNLPLDVAIAPDGTVYVLDAGNFRVQAFTQDGGFLRSWGKVGNGFGQFARPKSIATDSDGNVYVLDAVFGNVQIFNSDGQLLMPLGYRDEKNDVPGRYAVAIGLAVDEKDFVFVLDQVMKKLDIFQRLPTRT